MCFIIFIIYKIFLNKKKRKIIFFFFFFSPSPPLILKDCDNVTASDFTIMMEELPAGVKKEEIKIFLDK
jgi:hypothetical protein